MKHTILIPVYNDWKSLNLLLSQINDQINYIGSVQILIVNDASTQKPIFNKKSNRLIQLVFSFFCFLYFYNYNQKIIIQNEICHKTGNKK